MPELGLFQEGIEQHAQQLGQQQDGGRVTPGVDEQAEQAHRLLFLNMETRLLYANRRAAPARCVAA